jgi:hypothetical protein
MAAPWVPDASLAGETGRVSSEFLWVALECPAGLPVHMLKDDLFPKDTDLLLGRFVAEIKEGLEPGRNCVTIGWPIGNDRRKLVGPCYSVLLF